MFSNSYNSDVFIKKTIYMSAVLKPQNDYSRFKTQFSELTRLIPVGVVDAFIVTKIENFTERERVCTETSDIRSRVFGSVSIIAFSCGTVYDNKTF